MTYGHDDPLDDPSTQRAFARHAHLLRQYYGFPHGSAARLQLFDEAAQTAADDDRVFSLAYFVHEAPLRTLVALVPVRLTTPAVVRAVTAATSARVDAVPAPVARRKLETLVRAGLAGIPVLVLILFTFHGLALFKVNVTPFAAGVIALSAFATAHVAENLRGTVEQIEREAPLTVSIGVAVLPDAAALTEGVKFNLTYGGKSYVATVVDSAGIAGQNRLVPITATIEGGQDLPVGATARASYRAKLGDGLLIPSAALQVEGGENAVYTVKSGRSQRQVVDVVAESGNQLAVSGLEEGDAVISPLPAGVQDGAKVVVK